MKNVRSSAPILFPTILVLLIHLYLSRRNFFVHAHTIIMEALSCFLCRLICPALKTNHDAGEGEGEAPFQGKDAVTVTDRGVGQGR